jgi:fucose permease
LNTPVLPHVKNGKPNYVLSISLIGALFFIFGFVTWLNGILIPYLKIACVAMAFRSVSVVMNSLR